MTRRSTTPSPSMPNVAWSPPSGGAWKTIHARSRPSSSSGTARPRDAAGHHRAAVHLQIQDEHPDAGPLRGDPDGELSAAAHDRVGHGLHHGGGEVGRLGPARPDLAG